jgi:hypothetical protein
MRLLRFLFGCVLMPVILLIAAALIGVGAVMLAAHRPERD